MFHVAPMLPFFPDDEQQLERKRHLGNDVVMVLFHSGDTPIDLFEIKSQFNHVFCIVQKDKEKTAEKGTTQWKYVRCDCRFFLSNFNRL
tara:strand:- start:338 stop:604 length:267 start_codon:yes stop_codon:yes gene_type:complete